MNMKIADTLKIAADLFADRGNAGDALDVGMGNYQLCIDAATMYDYRSCLDAYLEHGFQSYVNNGARGLQNCVYTESLTNADMTVTVTYLNRLSKLYITAACGQPLSAHLHDVAAETKQIIGNAQTTLHMLEMFENGNSFLIRLKNGHFIMNDGGLPADLPYFLDYLESLAPAGEKPVIDAWMFSHAHSDHVGLLKGFILSPDQIERICVEGVYLNHPAQSTVEALYATMEDQWLEAGLPLLRNSAGAVPPVYRLQTGQRYYFHDITVDVVHTQEQLPFTEYSYTDRAEGYNDTSVWLMYTVEGQRILLTGDADTGSIRKVMEVYPPDFWDMTMYAVPHHGANVEDVFTRICRINTLLYTGWWGREDLPVRPDGYKKEETLRLQTGAQEFMSWGDGTKIFAFPYHTGEVLRLAPQQWQYHPGYAQIIRKKRCI